MARKPLFSGNYGSALARVDTAPIVGAGRAQGQTFKQIGGMIQQYGLNKEKQKKNQAFIKGQSNLLDMLSEQDPEQADRYAIMKEQLNNPDVSLTERTELGKQLMQNVTLSNQMQNQMLNRETQEQALDTAKKLQESQITIANLKAEIAGKTKDSVISGADAGARAKTSQANMLGVDEAYQKDLIKKDLENKQSQIDYRRGAIQYQDLLKKRLQNSDTNGLSSSNSDRYREISKQIDGLMDDFATVVDGEKLTIEDMIEDITDSGEIILRDDISVRAESSIPRLRDLLKEKHELNQSRILQNVPMSDGSRRNMTQAEFNIMLQKDREKEEQAQLLKQAQLQAGSASNLKPPTMFK
jgi:hypothetical protein